MDRIKMTREDTDRLFDWMMAHEDYVKRIPAPLSAIKIIFEYNPLRVRFRRNQNKLMVYASTSERNLGKLEFELRDGGFVPQKDMQTLGITSEALIHVFSVYIGLMTYMVYGKVEAHVEGSKRAMRKHGNTHARVRSTYSLIWNKTEPSGVSHGGHHASPKGCFTVRGHYRHYKSGSIVWIKEYQKGKGKVHGKLYKLGGVSSMNKYDVFVSEVLERAIKVDAPDEATALRKVKTAYRNGEIVLTADDFVGAANFTAFRKEVNPK